MWFSELLIVRRKSIFILLIYCASLAGLAKQQMALADSPAKQGASPTKKATRWKTDPWGSMERITPSAKKLVRPATPPTEVLTLPTLPAEKPTPSVKELPSSDKDLVPPTEVLTLPTPPSQPKRKKRAVLVKRGPKSIHMVLQNPLQFPMTLLVGFPHPLNIAVDTKLFRHHFSFGAAAGFLPYTHTLVTGEPIDFKFTNFELRTRWHPWAGSFFVGFGFGKHNLTTSGTKNFMVAQTEVPVTVTVPIRSLYATPHVGWLWVWSSGFILGVEAGWLFPIGPQAELEISTSAQMTPLLDIIKTTDSYKKLEKDVQTAGQEVGATKLPFATLVRIGWSF